jgi:kumamolisin
MNIPRTGRCRPVFLRLRRAWIGAALAALALGAGGSASAESSVALPGHVTKRMRAATKLGRLPADENVELSLGVRLDQALLDQALAQIYGPKAPRPRRFLSPAEFTQKFDLAEKRRKLKDFARAAGLAVNAAEDRPNSLLVKVSGPAGLVEKAFSVQLNRYRGADGQVFRAHDTEPMVPASLAPHISAVIGLSKIRGVMKPHVRRFRPVSARPGEAGRPASGAASARPLFGTGPGGGLAPADIKKIYSLSGALTGSGQTVALVELDGYSPADITQYINQFNLANTIVTPVKVNGQPNDCGCNQDLPCTNNTLLYGGCAGGSPPQSIEDGMIEVTLDIEMVLALASGVSQVLVYTALNTDNAPELIYDQMASDNTAKIISTSWGLDEQDRGSAQMDAENATFKQMALNGQTVLAAAGDSGAYDASGQTDSSGNLESWAGNPLTDDPASQPYVTGVGGTSLSGTGINAIGSSGGPTETVWNDGCPSGNGTFDPATNCYKYSAGGGGVANYTADSTTYYWPLPNYQSGVSGTYSQQYRNVPDVALNADYENSPYNICVGGTCNDTTNYTTLVGGTSAAAPLWAALAAQINQNLSAHGLGLLGFANSTLYQLGTSASYNSYFNDVPIGTNNGYYNSGPGYDNASGWGSFKGDALIAALAAPAPVAPVITSALAASVQVDTAFSYQITASNIPTSFNATGYPAGLTVDNKSGLIFGTPAATGQSSITISATNAGGTGSATLTLTVTTAAPVPVITSALAVSGQVGAAFSYQITASNSPTSFNASGLPNGLSVNQTSGLISGTPTSAGQTSVTISAGNASGTGTATLTLTITNTAPVPVITSAPAAYGTVNTAFSYQITASNGPTSFGATGLPQGLGVNAAGLISGTPTTVGTANVAISAGNASGTGTATLALTISTLFAPANAQIVGVGSNTVSLSWSPNGNAPSTYYEISLAPDSAFGVVAAAVDVTSTAAVVGGLFPGTTYYARLRAVNSAQQATAFVTAGSACTKSDANATSTLASAQTTNTITHGAVQLLLPPGTFPSAATVYISDDPLDNPLRINSSLLAQALSQAPTGKLLLPPSQAYPTLLEIVPTLDGANYYSGPLGSSATLSFPYAEVNGIVAGSNPPVAPATLQIFTLDASVLAWDALPTTLDSVNKIVFSTGVSHFSVFALFGASAFSASASPARVYPDPWKIGTGGRFDTPAGGIGLTFANLPTQGYIRILTLSGEKVIDLNISGADGGSKQWDGRNAAGRAAASGVYFAQINSSVDGSSRILKFAIER